MKLTATGTRKKPKVLGWKVPEKYDGFALPPGVKHKPEGAGSSQDGEIVQTGDFQFDLSVVTPGSIFDLRKFLPYQQYVRLKNRFSARESRLRTKQKLENKVREVGNQSFNKEALTQ